VRIARGSVLAAALAVALTLARAGEPAGELPSWFGAPIAGDATLEIANENAFARPIPVLPVEDLRRFTFGNRVFTTNWVAAPASVEAFDGLGPVFNRVSCSACHIRDGRGRPPEREEEPLESMLMRLSLPGEGGHGVKHVPRYGDQLNEKSLPGVPPEGRTVLRYTEKRGQYSDGEPYTLAVPHYQFAALAFGPLPEDTLFSPRVAAPVFGLGLLEAVTEADILARADPQDADHDGISGRANQVWDVTLQRMALGRFGWKANQPSLRQQNATAALNDIGLTTSMFPQENVAAGQDAAARAPSGASAGAAELRDDFLDKLTFYLQALAVPAPRFAESPDAAQGARLFARAGCTGCHTPTLTTGEYAAVPALSHQIIHPFSDLLLHDMGEALADGRPDYDARGSEWRTPPLWGIGHTEVVNRHTRFLHDGRARSLEEAVLWHDGEAIRSREAFVLMTRNERRALLDFLGAL
jgi:CxxC motif-containing protein (DUF1111 family)